ncbi:ribosome maturation factor RimP [Desulfurispirillum indicum]|uniref:Ribosome maturation factor RimP n=1 Tax=Desulfurispirillum indicum (strain ATCC BAA-1389 / DSM 22839 / S5) TaxID=653733 RepID=E6W7D4_DESIS|nr:ribosome maturation factor RimP [Desulfurispirillum indicum]ADU66301.1 protein of unknown function DUF150 [Desulfurispirillum indicum S5]UCZ55635.1 ribosome maturation factor RimP [Desulfurispirillum indicum]
MDKERILRGVSELLQPIVQELALELFDVELINASGWILRVYLDKEGGVSLDECERVSIELGTLLDVEDIIGFRYTLEVSSPGVNRKLRHRADFEKYLGRLARIRTSEVLLNTKLHIGYLADISDTELTIREKDRGILIPVPLAIIEKANLEYEWE